MVRTPTTDSVSVPPYLVDRSNSPDFLRSLRSLRLHSASPLRPQLRYLQIVDLLFHYRLLTAAQIQLLLFSAANRSGCQETLKKLVDNQWIDRMKDDSVNEPFVYLLSNNSKVGNRLMKYRYGEKEYKRRMYKLGSIPHLLGINDVRVRVEKCCIDLKFSLSQWIDSPPLQETLYLVPDSYFMIQRQVDGDIRSAGHFLELQHSIRAGTALDKKLKNYANFYYSKQYEAWAKIRGMRVLVVFTTEMGVLGEVRVERALKQAQQLGMTRARFASLDSIRSCGNILTDAIWYSPDSPSAAALY